MKPSESTSLVSRSAQVAFVRGATAALWAGIGLAAAIIGLAVTLRWYRHMPSLEDPRWRMLLTLMGIAAGAWMARPIVAAARKLPRIVPSAGIVGLIVSQICFYTLVWTTWKPSAMLWRVWWMALVVCVAAAHASWVRLLVGGTPRPSIRILAAFAYAGIAAGAGMIASLALGQTPLPETSTAKIIAIVVPVAVSILGTLALIIRAWNLRDHEIPVSRKIGWAVAGVCGIAAISFYLGRVTAPPPQSFQLVPAALAHLSLSELDAQMSADLQRLKVVVTGLDELIQRTDAMGAQLRATRQAEGRDYYRPAEEDQIRAAFMSYLAYRAALLRQAATYGNFESISDPSLRARAFLIGACAGASVMRASQHLVQTYRDEPAARRKLNEPDSAFGLPADSFEQIYAAVTDSRNISKIDEMSVYFLSRRESWRDATLMPDDEFAWLDRRIGRLVDEVRGSRLEPGSAYFEQLSRRVLRDTYTPIYATQSVVSTLIGDTRMVARPPFVSLHQIRRIQPQLRPGDVFLERRNWFMSNAFLPGFWPHAALYCGTIEDLEQLGLVRRTPTGWTSDEPAIRDRLDQFLARAEDGELHTVIESVSEGVIFNSLAHSMHADYVAVLRPRRLSDAERARAIARAFAHVGKPYDFEFDFFSADKLVCTELVYRAYDGMIKFDLVPIMGRNTLPALEIARKFVLERTREDRDFDFVAFLDAVPDANAARHADVEEFCRSIDRPRGFNE